MSTTKQGENVPEPTTTSTASLSVLAVALLGPLAGPYVLIVFAALSGALWPLSASATASRLAGGWLLLRCTLMAVVLTSMLAGLLQQYYGIPHSEALAPVAFFVGALGNGWRPVFDALASALGAMAGRLGGRKDGK